MSLRKITSFILIFTCSLVLPGARDDIQPPPEPAELSRKERSALIAIYESLVRESKPLSVGAAEQELLDRLGPPDGIMTVGNRKRLSYGGGNVVVADGRVVELNDLPGELLSTPNPQAYEDYQMAMGKVHYMGEWMTPAQAEDVYEKAVNDRALTQQRISIGNSAKAEREKQIAISKASYHVFQRDGAAIQLAELLSPGRITVVDFYADWCGPCKAIDPYLRALANEPDVAVRKVDIVNWESPVARQWGLRSIPNMRVYDKNGDAVGGPTHDIREIYQNVRRARRG